MVDFIRDNMKAVVIGLVVVVVVIVAASLIVVYTTGTDGALAIRDALPIIIVATLGIGAIGLIVLWWRSRYTYEEYDEYE